MTIHQELGTVLVTGTSTGIGRATALHLDRVGFQVFASVRSARDVESLSSEAFGRLTPIQLDVTDQLYISHAEEEISKAVGDAGFGIG